MATCRLKDDVQQSTIFKYCYVANRSFQVIYDIHKPIMAVRASQTLVDSGGGETR